jgi:hypothetical protein
MTTGSRGHLERARSNHAFRDAANVMLNEVKHLADGTRLPAMNIDGFALSCGEMLPTVSMTAKGAVFQ